MEAINVLIYPLALIVTLGLLVTIHELGHFVIARWSGVKVLRFSVGFGRPIWSRLDKHGTEFVIARIPFGGYVRMLDDREPEPVGEIRPGDKAYLSVSVWWRIAIALGESQPLALVDVHSGVGGRCGRLFRRPPIRPAQTCTRH